jgi:fumarate reductase (CoM/CoB) subunit A
MELAGRDEVARSIAIEIIEGRGTEHNGVYLDLSYIPSKIIEDRLPTMLEHFLDIGIDIRDEPIEVTPSAHHAMGGIRINTRCETNIKGLYAAGEVAGGVHGGNRVGGNALADTIVFGAIAGASAANFASNNDLPNLPKESLEEERKIVFSALERRDGINQIVIRKELSQLMWDKVGIFRNGAGLQNALTKIEKFLKDIPALCVENKHTRYNMEWINALEISDMLFTSKMIARSALIRKESKGAHYRTDYPAPDNINWFKNIVIRCDNGKMNLETTPVNVTNWTPPWMK